MSARSQMRNTKAHDDYARFVVNEKTRDQKEYVKNERNFINKLRTLKGMKALPKLDISSGFKNWSR